MEGLDFDVDVELFIEEIKQHPSIWDVRSEEYKDRKKKQSAWEEVCEYTFLDFQTKSENERNSIIKRLALKWKNIRDNYMRSVRKNNKSGQPGRKYIYSKHLSFLHESMALSAAMSSTEENSLDSPLSQGAEDEESPSDPVALTPIPIFKRPRSDQTLLQYETAEPKKKEKFTSFGEHVAEKLRYMPPDMVSITQKLIGDVIFYGETKNLNMTSRVATDFSQNLGPRQNSSPRPENTT